MKNGLIWNEQGFLHPFLLFLTAFFLLLLTSGSLLLQTKVQSTNLLFEQYKLEQAASIAFKTVEKHYLPNLNSVDDKTFTIHNKAMKADITITKEEQHILVRYEIQADESLEPIIYYKKYPS
ncbi:hypothetical protein [Terribacillus saccharophilus]|uniref:Competence protein ComGG n=1 Tax=Terribacillus saccharophilus TaxID=361277 RepID=A0ABX4H2E7_9BACI|nr:hypothetical protein [Terribacillus saccharophilus]PAD36909.1 hypothetical protein CHH56_03465 [Terribacillus saccharophilus]PAD97892.1 hypothetical protein CHH50_04170 [Terribacillus saccharophilus]PAE01274.1 hypothetical protein CHH48_04165 [Terribacillus saccharophilus]